MSTATDSGYEIYTEKVTCPKCEHEFEVELQAEVEVHADITSIKLTQ